MQGSYARVSGDGQPAGYAIVYRWTALSAAHGQKVSWGTQLVVHHEYRECRLVLGLLNHLRKEEDHVHRVHPAACLAAEGFGGRYGYH